MHMDTYWNGFTMAQYMVFDTKAKAAECLAKLGDDEDTTYKIESDSQSPGFMIVGYEANGECLGRL